MTRRTAVSTYGLLLDDAARWIRPEEIAIRSEVTKATLIRLLVKHPPLRAMAWFRIGGAAKAARVRGVPSWVQRRLLRLYGLELAVGAAVGGGLYIAHPVGCVLHADSIGDNVSVISQVTFGTRGDGRWPSIGAGSYFGAGARVLGGITVGDGSMVGANAVVLQNVQEGATVVGVPAREVD